MRFHFGADVRRPDGGKLGELKRVVFDPSTDQVASIVVTHASIDGREIVVPIGVVQYADDESVLLAISEEQFNFLDDYATQVESDAPPPVADNVTSDLIHDPVDVPDVPPVGAATGVESIAYTPVVEEVLDVPVGDQALEHATRVWAIDGDLGRLLEVWVSDETHRMTQFIVERGAVFLHTVEVPYSVVTRVSAEDIVLSVHASSLTSDEDV